MAEQGWGARVARLARRILGRGRVGRGEATRSYPGDFQGVPTVRYTPNPGNGTVADPGEIVWTWVPFEEDPRRGKDRPVLVIGHDGRWLLALPLSSKDHDRGVGGSRRGRASAVRVDRILRIDPAGVRRQGAVLDKVRFLQVAAAVRAAA